MLSEALQPVAAESKLANAHSHYPLESRQPAAAAVRVPFTRGKGGYGDTVQNQVTPQMLRTTANGGSQFGDQVARKYVQRITLIKTARDIDEVMALPGLLCHPLTQNRKGQYAVKLTGFYRLVFTLEDDMLTVARIEEVSKHYGD